MRIFLDGLVTGNTDIMKRTLAECDEEKIYDICIGILAAAKDFKEGGDSMPFLELFIAGLNLVTCIIGSIRSDFQLDLMQGEISERDGIIDGLKSNLSLVSGENESLKVKLEQLAQENWSKKRVNGFLHKPIGETTVAQGGGDGDPSEQGSSCGSGGQRRHSWVTDQTVTEPARKRVRYGMLGSAKTVMHTRMVLGRLGGAVVPIEQHFRLPASTCRSLYDDPAYVVGESFKFLSNKSNPIISKIKLDFSGDYSLSTRIALNYKSRVECGSCAIRHGLGGGPRVFLIGDQHCPPIVGAAPEGGSTCMPTIRIADANEQTIYEFLHALDKADRTWNKIEEGSILFVQSFSMLMNLGSPDRYFEGIFRLRNRLMDLYGQNNGVPKVEVVPAIIPVLIQTESEAEVFSKYLEIAYMAKERNLWPMLTGPVWSFFTLGFNENNGEGVQNSGGPDCAGGISEAKIENSPNLTTLGICTQVHAGASVTACSGAKKVLGEIGDFFGGRGVDLNCSGGGQSSQRGAFWDFKGQLSKSNFRA